MRTKRLLLAVGLALLLPACDSKVAPPTPTPPPPTPEPPRVISQGNGSLEAHFLAVIPISTTLPGTLDVTVDWTFASNDVDVYLARGTCSFDQFIAQQCTMIAFSESVTAKPEKITAAGTTAGAYTLLIGNAGPDNESVAYQVVLSPTRAASATAQAQSPARAGAYRGFVTLGR